MARRQRRIFVAAAYQPAQVVEPVKAELSPPPPPADLPACFFCGYEFTRNDTGELTTAEKTACYGPHYGGEWNDTRGDKERCRPVPVPFLGVTVCQHCHTPIAAARNTIPGGQYTHPSIRALDAARERRLRQLDEAVPKPYNPATWNHPSLRKWDAAVKTGRIDLGIRAAYRLLPGVAKIGKGVKGLAVECETMDEETAAAFRAETERRRTAELEYQRQRDARREEDWAEHRRQQERQSAAELELQAA